ncbi:lactate utilization protein [Desulfobotulus sp. H1]|uniref:Lactate utilization protein n=1 Tax=Desulfobotulus pelophilus TaxID=2823377 RepID=A0ABT3N8C0_9BACT|nr:lactate utilization protein [Desulfobotulus pelophilus]MCW7753702.1 lactate utilization protein [Desulfobotulus pelophilus]
MTQTAIDAYWKKKLEDLAEKLTENGFVSHVVGDTRAACNLVTEQLIPAMHPASIAWGGSRTFIDTGLYDILRQRSDIKILDTFDKSIDRESAMERRRQALLCDLFFTGTNAITEKGVLVNLDMIGNRVAAITFGPRKVVILAGRNKVVRDVAAGMERTRGYAALVNIRRLGKQTPCASASRCMNCSSEDRICNVWTLTEKCFPKGRIHVVLINEDLGF